MNASEKNRLLGVLADQRSTAKSCKDAIIALGAFEDDEEVVVALRGASNSGNESLRFYARRSLKRLGAFFNSDANLADLLTTLSGAAGEFSPEKEKISPAEVPKIEIFEPDSDAGLNPLGLTIESLTAQGKAFIEELERESNPQKLVYRIQMIAELEDATFIDPLVIFAYCKDNPQVKATIVSVIGKFGDSRYLPVVESFLHHEDSRIRANAVEALGEVGSSASIQHILPFVTDGDNRIRANAAKALWKFKNEEVLEVLEEMVESGSEPMRHSALYTLGKMSDDRARELLEQLCDDSSEEISGKAEELISEMGTRLKMKKERLAKYKAIINEDAAGQPHAASHHAGHGSAKAVEVEADTGKKSSKSKLKSKSKSKLRVAGKFSGSGFLKFLFKAAVFIGLITILTFGGLFAICRVVPGVGNAVVKALEDPFADYGIDPGIFTGLKGSLAGILIPAGDSGVANIRKGLDDGTSGVGSTTSGPTETKTTAVGSSEQTSQGQVPLTTPDSSQGQSQTGQTAQTAQTAEEPQVPQTVQVAQQDPGQGQTTNDFPAVSQQTQPVSQESQSAPASTEFKVKSQGDPGLIEALYVTILDGYNRKSADTMFSTYHPEYSYLGSNLETIRKVTIEEFGYGQGLVMKIDTFEPHIEGDRAKVRFSYYFEGEAAGGIVLDKEFSLTKRTDILLKGNGKWLLKFSE